MRPAGRRGSDLNGYKEKSRLEACAGAGLESGKLGKGLPDFEQKDAKIAKMNDLK